MATRRATAGEDRRTRSGSASDDLVTGGSCTVEEPIACELKVAVGVATEAARANGGSNAARLESLAQRLERGGTVSISAAKKELRVWAQETQANRSAPPNDKRWARTISEALSLDA
jgi:hypothetical protein